MPIRGVLFDKDGTLFDFATTWVAWTETMLAKLAGDDAARGTALATAIGFDRAARAFRPDSVVVAGTPHQVAAALAPVLGGAPEGLVGWLNEQAARAPQAEAVPLAPLLDGLIARGLVLGVATNDAETAARAHLAAAGVVDRFGFIAGCDSGHGAKPGPGMCLGFAAATGLAPGEVAMVGDSRHDLKAGRAAGMRPVAVLTGLAGADELAPLAEVVLPDIGHLPAWLAGQG